ncbi:dual specificity calcium/calmodulin-dependent 3',5'-cyclic nucleotide phosphodiesterase 1A-like isoform X2 [Montipora foliosa]|uniref:dual specificity calcium/calmodulin-dependent 3',5'-cyclic nucleotide phosphodiesterase 1A-like isoform X2 n=1 Tax=Montipora foliosa TaxID=591990 RepID=UPI0035F1CE14
MGSVCVKGSEANQCYVYDVDQLASDTCALDPTVQPHIHVTTVPVRSSCDSTPDDAEVDKICDGYTTYDPTSSSSAVALSRLHQIMEQLNTGNALSLTDMKQELGRAVAMLDKANSTSPVKESRSSTGALSDIDGEIESGLYSDDVSEEVREWIATTFARTTPGMRRKSLARRHTFRSVVQAVKASLYVNKIYQNMTERSKLKVPEEVQVYLKKLDSWTFDPFKFNEVTGGHPLRYIGHELFTRYDLQTKFKITTGTLDRFLLSIEDAYKKPKNPYHNELHATDVAHSVHYFLSRVGLMHCMSELEIFAILLSAIIHDVEHTGTTNNFHVNSRSHLALLYNDRSVLENHHLCCAFTLLKSRDKDIFASLTPEQYSDIRTLVIDMVLATDMSSHFEQLRTMKAALSVLGSQIEKSHALEFILHVSDIANPAKDWELHRQWTSRIMEEFFCQGDRELELGLPISPLCDRSVTCIPESQLGFIEFVVLPAFDICSEMSDILLETKTSQVAGELGLEGTGGKERAWVAPIADNKRRWKEQCKSSSRDELNETRTTSNHSLTSRTSIGVIEHGKVDENRNRSPRNSKGFLTPIMS